MSNEYPYRPQPAKSALADAGLSQRGFAKKYGLAHTLVSKAMNGRITPFDQVARALEEATGRPAAELFETWLLVRTVWYRDALMREALGEVETDG